MKPLFVLIFILFTQHSFAGPITSGGGKGVVCRDLKGKIASVELLDLWEARVLYKRQILISDAPVKTQVNQALENLKHSLELSELSVGEAIYSPSEHFLFLARTNIEPFLNQQQNLLFLRGVTLNLTDDSYEVARPSNCTIEQVVTYVDSSSKPQIVINQDLFEMMDLTNRSALIVHEAFYAVMRSNFQEMNSLRSRRAVGYVFSGQSFIEKKSILKSGYLTCMNEPIKGSRRPVSLIYFYRNSEGEVKSLTSFNWGAPSIGFFESSQTIPFWPADKHICDNSSSKGTTIKMDLEGMGPADFTQSLSIAWDCKNKKFNFYVVSDLINPKTPATKRKLECYFE